MSGYLRQKQKNGKWRRSWFVLKDCVLYTYKANEDMVAVDTLPVLGWQVDAEHVEQGEGDSFVPAGEVITLSHDSSDTEVFSADTDITKERWVEAFKEATRISGDSEA